VAAKDQTNERTARKCRTFHIYHRRRTSLTNLCRSFAHRKDLKKVTKLEAQIPYHEGRGNKDEVVKIQEQIQNIWQKAREEAQAELIGNK
jgi:hypothetical protein